MIDNHAAPLAPVDFAVVCRSALSSLLVNSDVRSGNTSDCSVNSNVSGGLVFRWNIFHPHSVFLTAKRVRRVSVLRCVRIKKRRKAKKCCRRWSLLLLWLLLLPVNHAFCHQSTNKQHKKHFGNRARFSIARTKQSRFLVCFSITIEKFSFSQLKGPWNLNHRKRKIIKKREERTVGGVQREGQGENLGGWASTQWAKKKWKKKAEKEPTRENLKENCIWKLPIPDERKRGQRGKAYPYTCTHTNWGASQYDLNTHARTHTGTHLRTTYSDVNAGSAVGVAVDAGREVCVVCMTIHLFLINAIYQTQTTSDSKRWRRRHDINLMWRHLACSRSLTQARTETESQKQKNGTWRKIGVAVGALLLLRRRCEIRKKNIEHTETATKWLKPP